MVAKLEVEVLGIENARREIRRFGDVAAIELINKATLLAEREARILAKPHTVDTGELARSIQTDLANEGGELRGRIWTEHVAALATEYGRTSSRFPPPEPIRDWIRRHGGDEADTFIVQRAIALRGTRPLRYMAGAMERVRQRLGDLVRDVDREVARRFPRR